MNIDLSKTKKKATKLSLGLNKRSNVLGDDSDSDNEAAASSTKASVNQAVAREQAALRQRAQAAMVAEDAAAVYDYDGAYDSFRPAEEKKPKEPEERKSRYIGDLLQSAQQRQREREMAMERKIAKEQAEEEDDYRDKQKFVTAGYKRKLEERQLWQAEQERQEEAAGDVNKSGMAGFFGNLNRNVALGGGNEEDKPKESMIEEPIEAPAPAAGLDFLQGFESGGATENEPPAVTIDDKTTRRLRRQAKVAAARERYWQRQSSTA